MIELAGRVLASVIAMATLVGFVANLAPIPIWQGCLVCVGWGLAYFGDELAPIINLDPRHRRRVISIRSFVQSGGCFFLRHSGFTARECCAYGEHHAA